VTLDADNLTWETSLLARAARIHLHRPVRQFFDDLFSNPADQPLDIGPAQVFADDLTFTRDPFDVLIAASAQTIGLPPITRARQIRASGAVMVIW
jgi:PIN domain nuclease of toxin-antitoxin system